MRGFFSQPHPWLMQALGGLIAVIVIIPIGVVVWINVISNASATPPTPTAIPVPATSVPSSGNGVATPYWADVHTIFAANCTPCHISQAFGGLNLNTYATAMKGGSTGAGGPHNGPVIIPGNPTGSYIIQVLKGQQQPQMPLGRSPLPNTDIQTIYNWIKQGAKQT